MRYTLQDYSDIIFNGYEYSLPDGVKEIIQLLTSEYASFTNASETQTRDNITDNKTKKSGYFSKKQRSLSKNEKLDETWETQKAFKATVIEKKEGIVKSINDVRVCLNKISNKNYQIQRDIIIEYIENIINNKSDDSDSENINASNDVVSIANSIFDIASTNKFYSELYATLYKELIEKFPVFSNNIDKIIEQYKISIHTIKFIDPNQDYDSFCENNKLNDKRKAFSTFIINLMKKEILSISTISNLILYLELVLTKNIDVENMIYEVEEITENLFILITMSIPELKSDPSWEEIVSNIKLYSQFKAKEHLSISSRAIFKYMDILDKIK